MPIIQFKDQNIHCDKQQILLDKLLAAGCSIPFSCRAGLCHSCLMYATAGAPPKAAQQGLNQEQLQNNGFLACQCHPEADLVVRLPCRHQDAMPAIITSVTALNQVVKQVKISPSKLIDYRPGQLIKLSHQGHERTYTLVSHPEQDQELLIHVQRIAGGNVSQWLCESAVAGDTVTLSDLQGDCYYQQTNPHTPLVFIAAEVGLGAMLGIVSDALWHQHRGPILLIHHVPNTADLFLQDTLRELCRQHHQLSYQTIVGSWTADTLNQLTNLQRSHFFFAGATPRIIEYWSTLQQLSIPLAQCSVISFDLEEVSNQAVDILGLSF
ncbi:2Fe-2S iron-sulfur cluster-binding protein [Zooshikella harenae]|uniref:2Fe-2S iron-sulfur cluster binding domain-containing protein n=1 Tax=Zooshikella harenae TaxID=2827238 RepID=A0ABS5Z7J1_9GAMM|nr:2Fe-2S iron-sulfur cluster binding domain-containing protein [Zooshikella harenae]MBU2710018.1 2Fe-2S iron-sulfur cluster binding domain-containing protein [Zooshikella harenae]